MSVPFSHEELEVKRNFLEIARDYLARSNEESDDNADLAYELAAALPYMNVADYLAEYLVQGVSQLVQQSVSRYYFSAIKLRPSTRLHYNIEASIKELKQFDFAGREAILAKLDDVRKARNKLAHEILKTKAEDLIEIDNAVRSLRDSTEELINLTDEMQLGMPPKNIDELLSQTISVPEQSNEKNEK